MKKHIAVLACLLMAVCSVTALAQDSRDAAQAKLTGALQGARVSLKIDMPATEKGVVVAAGKTAAVDQEKYQKRLKTYGTAIRSGEASVITGVRVSRNEIVVEFAGGGAPQIDVTALVGESPAPLSSGITESRARSRMNMNGDVNTNLRNPVPIDDQNVRSTVKYESAKRQREDSERAANYQARKKEALDKARAENLKKGSRITIKFDNRDTANLTPEDLTKLLAPYVSF